MNFSSEHRTSMIVAFDGESKCGKTTFADEVAQGAQYQKNMYAGNSLPDNIRDGLQFDETFAALRDTGFHGITTLSAGNVFRAAALYTIIAEQRGKTVDFFTPSDAPRLQSMLKEEGIVETLQNDKSIAERVSHVAKFSGVQALCGTLFCDAIQQAYFNDGGHNLVIVDARDPYGHLARNKMLGEEKDKILPLSVLRIYIDTPVEVAASRIKGSAADNLRLVADRRHADATRAELPVLTPTDTTPIQDWGYLVPFWNGTTIEDLSESLPVLHIKNGEESSLEYVKYIGDVLAASATMACYAIDNYLTTANLQLQFSLFKYRTKFE